MSPVRRQRVDVRSIYDGSHVLKFVIHPSLEERAVPLLSELAGKMLIHGKEEDDYLVGWGPLKIIRDSNEIRFYEYNTAGRVWIEDLTPTVTNISGQLSGARETDTKLCDCFYNQNMAVHSDALSAQTMVFTRIPSDNIHHSGWFVYSLEVWQTSEGETISVPNRELSSMTSFECARKIGPQIVQALALPPGSTFAYKEGASHFVYVARDENKKVDFLDYDK